MRMIRLLALGGAALAVLGCTETRAPTASTPLAAVSAAARNNGISICGWGLSDYTGTWFLASGGGPDAYTISQLTGTNGFGKGEFEEFYIESEAGTGMTTVYGDTLVVIKGNLPGRSYSSSPWGGTPPSDTTPISLAVDLRLTVTPRRAGGTGVLPSGALTRFMHLTGTIDGVQIQSSSSIQDKVAVGRYGKGTPPRGATPFNWWGANGAVSFCAH